MTIKYQLNRISAFIFIGISMLISACSPAKLSYVIDPEINHLETLAKQAPIIAVSVIDLRHNNTSANLPGTTNIPGPENEADVLRHKLIEHLKQNNFKIISQPLLADLAIELSIKQLDVNVKQETFKSNISASSQLHLKARNKQTTFEKNYRAERAQEVANPVNKNDVTGVVNLLLSQQLSSILSAPEIIQLTKPTDNQWQ